MTIQKKTGITRRRPDGRVKNAHCDVLPLCSSRKYPEPSHGWSVEILSGWGGEGRGSQKPNFLKESIQLNWNFPKGLGEPKNLLWVGEV